MSVAIRATDLIKGSLRLLNALAAGEEPTAQEMTDAFNTLNQMVDAWGTEKLTIPFVSRDVYPVTANQASYTIGPSGADFTADRPALGLEGAGLLLNSATPAVEISREVWTDDRYQAEPIKDLASTLFNAVYYNATYPNGTIILWPVPTTAENDLVLYVSQALSQFATLTTPYVLPPAYTAALRFNLAIDLYPEFGIKAAGLDPTIVAQAALYMRNLKANNLKPDEMTVLFQSLPSAGYNILNDTFTH